MAGTLGHAADSGAVMLSLERSRRGDRCRGPGRVADAAADARRRRRARRRLAPDGLQRRQQPRPAAARHPCPRAGGDRRAGLLAQPRRPQPAHPRLPPDRPAVHPGPGGHRQRDDGPLRPLAGRDVAARPATTCCCSRATPRTRRRVRRPAPLDRRRRVRRHRHLSRQPAGRLAGDPPGAVRRVRPALGQPRRHAPVGRRRRRGRHRAGHRPPARRGHERIAWIGWRKDSWIGEDRRSGWTRALHDRGLPTTGLASRVEDTVVSGREASAVLLDEARPTRLRLRLRHPRHGRPAHAGRPRPRRRAATSPSSASTTPRSPRSCRPASPPSGSRSRRSPSRS